MVQRFALHLVCNLPLPMTICPMTFFCLGWLYQVVAVCSSSFKLSHWSSAQTRKVQKPNVTQKHSEVRIRRSSFSLFILVIFLIIFFLLLQVTRTRQFHCSTIHELSHVCSGSCFCAFLGGKLDCPLIQGPQLVT